MKEAPAKANTRCNSYMIIILESRYVKCVCWLAPAGTPQCILMWTSSGILWYVHGECSCCSVSVHGIQSKGNVTQHNTVGKYPVLWSIQSCESRLCEQEAWVFPPFTAIHADGLLSVHHRWRVPPIFPHSTKTLNFALRHGPVCGTMLLL